jgi:Leucine-rich repeat (LRR) protein
MAQFDELPDQILLKIFSYLGVNELAFHVRNVCTRWRAISERDELWNRWCLSPEETESEEFMIGIFVHYPETRQFKYYGTCNVIENLSQYCTKLRILHVPYIKLSAADLKLATERLTQLYELCVSISTTEEGLEMTRIIGQCTSLISLQLRSCGENGVKEGLLKPIADGCPNLDTLRSESFNCPNSDIYYLMQCKRRQLVSYGHYGLVSADLIRAMNECTNLKRLAFVGVTFDGPFKEMPPISQLQRFAILEISRCRLPVLKIIPLTLFRATLSHLTYVGITYALADINDLMKKIMMHCPSMTHLDLEGNNGLDCRGLRALHSCEMLRHLDVSYCQELGGSRAFKYIADGCPNLDHLDVSGNSITNGVFRQILRCRNLKTLFMKDCDLERIDLKLISTSLPGLKDLFIGPDFHIRDEVMSEMQRRMPNLTVKRASAVNGSKEYTFIKSKFVDDQ